MCFLIVCPIAAMLLSGRGSEDLSPLTARPFTKRAALFSARDAPRVPGILVNGVGWPELFVNKKFYYVKRAFF